ncbi:MAG: hypothetical protein NVSMB1_05620 [Polyangiales bacterium]
MPSAAPGLSAPEAKTIKPAAGTRTAWVRSLSTGCAPSDLEVVLPFYEGLRLKPAALSLRTAKSEYLNLAYPGTLSMPLVAWRCGEGDWTAVITNNLEMPTDLLLKTKGDTIEVRHECFGVCAFQEVHAHGPWSTMAKAVAEAFHLVAAQKPLASRYDRYHFFVRQWVEDASIHPLHEDWTAAALRSHMKKEDARTISFAFGLDPNEVDLEGHYFWSDGAMAEMQALVAANPTVAQFRWLNLRTYKYSIPALGIDRPPPPKIREAAKVYADGVYDFPQYVFKSLEMCLGAEAWQQSRFDEMKKLVGLGFKVIALDEFPAPVKWGSEACRATNHLHRPNDFADEWRVTLDLVRRLAVYAREHGVMLSSEEPSTILFPFTSGYTDGLFNDPPDMYEFWQKVGGAERIPLFSTMFGDQITPYTRPGIALKPAKGWMVQEKIFAGQ